MNREVEERHGLAGALPSVWGVGGAISGPPTQGSRSVTGISAPGAPSGVTLAGGRRISTER